ncbi:hypothetical protein OAI33_00840 [Pirellulaceae bacterium]|nr:hypothetical protein [Pirellulaceae bacterium]
MGCAHWINHTGQQDFSEREPTYDRLFAMAKAVGLRINLSARPN